MYIETERLYLRQVTLNDFMYLYDWKNSLLLRKMSVGLKTNISPTQQKNDILSSLKNDYDLYTIIVNKSNDFPVGYIRINWLDSFKKIGWLRFGMGDCRNKGFMNEALLATLEYHFNKNVFRFEAEVLSFNKASLKLLSNLNFTIEGTRRKAHYQEDSYHDVHILGLLKEDLNKI